MTCLCLTKNRRRWLPQAIQCFLNQSYPHKELLILADGESVRDLVPDDLRIRLLEIEERNIGDKRNFGCDQARGAVIAHWDDDDYSEPGRLDDQIVRLIESGKSVTGYHSMRFHDLSTDRWWNYRGASHYVLGTSLLYKKDWWARNKFLAIQIGEDMEFAKRAELFRELVTGDGTDLMFARDHGANSHPRDRAGSCWSLIA